MKLFYTYLIYLTNKKSSLYGHIYYGKHITTNILDGYVGSGTILKKYLKKYPNDYYKKILNLYSTEEELNKAEYDLIHPHLNKFYCINLIEGGHGGAQGKISSTKISNKLKGIPKTYKAGYNFYNNGRTNKGENNPFYGKTHTLESKKIMSEKRIEHLKLNIPFQTGKKWVNNGVEQTYIDVSLLDKYLSNGYHLGMKKRLNNIGKNNDDEIFDARHDKEAMQD